MADSQQLSDEERLRRLEDRAEIRQLIQDYRRHLDARDLESYSQLFAADGEWLGGTGYGKGPAGIRDMLSKRLAGNPGPPGPTSWHLVTEPEIMLDGNSATGAVTWSLIQRGEGDTPVMRLLGHYEDSYVREKGRWRFQRRVAHTDIPHRELDIPDHWVAARAAGSGGGTTVLDGDSRGARLRRLEDREQIHQLLAEYKRVLDSKDFSGYAALFAEEGEFVAGPARAKGQAAIQAMVEAMPGSDLLGAKAGDDFHLMINPQVELDAGNADRARAQSTWVYVVIGEDGGPLVSKVGHYADELVREGGRWRFLRREAPMDIPAPEA